MSKATGGKFSNSNGSREWSTSFMKLVCSNCLKELKNNSVIYICEITKDIYCGCFNRTKNGACMNGSPRTIVTHSDIMTTLRFKK